MHPRFWIEINRLISDILIEFPLAFTSLPHFPPHFKFHVILGYLLVYQVLDVAHVDRQGKNNFCIEEY